MQQLHTSSARFIFLPLLLCMVVAFVPKEIKNQKNVIKWAIQKNSTLRINGKTNVSAFGCEIKGYYQMDTICYTEAANVNQILPLRGSLNIDVVNFDCHNNMLTKDLRKTLNAEEHPQLVIRFIALEHA